MGTTAALRLRSGNSGRALHTSALAALHTAARNLALVLLRRCSNPWCVNQCWLSNLISASDLRKYTGPS